MAFAEAGADLALVARSEDGLAATAEKAAGHGREAHVIRADVTEQDAQQRRAGGDRREQEDRFGLQARSRFDGRTADRAALVAGAGRRGDRGQRFGTGHGRPERLGEQPAPASHAFAYRFPAGVRHNGSPLPNHPFRLPGPAQGIETNAK